MANPQDARSMRGIFSRGPAMYLGGAKTGNVGKQIGGVSKAAIKRRLSAQARGKVV